MPEVRSRKVILQILRRFKKKYKYNSVDEMSILHLSMLARRLGIDVDSINEKYFNALDNELTKAIKEKVNVRDKG